MGTIILAMVLNSGITTETPTFNLAYYPKQVAFQDITTLTRLCTISGQYGIYVSNKIAFQVSGCVTDTIFKTGYESGEYNRPKL